jgi:SAM-dependent methyltransferase
VSSAPPAELYDQDDAANTCFVCGTPDYRVYRVARHFGFPVVFQRCRCGAIKQTPMPNQKFFDWFFNSELFFSAKQSQSSEIWGFYDYFKDEPLRLATSRYRYRRLRALFEGPRRALRVMKIGPSTGTMLHVLKQHGHQAMGCDVSAQFAGYAREHYGVRIDVGRFEKLGYADGEFDVVMLLNVIENVPNPAEFLGAIRRTLAPGGKFILNFVDMRLNLVAALQRERYFLFRPPICYAFSGAVLRRALHNAGFRVVREYADVRYLHLEKIFTLLRWRLAHRAARALRVQELAFPIYAYPSRMLVAERD